jgi:uncharacterized protein (DUF983 family)
MSDSLAPNRTLIGAAFACRCPRCGVGKLFRPGFTLMVNDACSNCGLNLAAQDSGDGPAVFMIFILGFLLAPSAFGVEMMFHPPLWVHALLWSAVMLGICVVTMRPLKAYVIALQFKHRRSTLEDGGSDGNGDEK